MSCTNVGIHTTAVAASASSVLCSDSSRVPFDASAAVATTLAASQLAALAALAALAGVVEIKGSDWGAMMA